MSIFNTIPISPFRSLIMSLISSTHLEANDWQVAPTELEIVNYDDFKIAYRQAVEKFIHSSTKKSLRKKTFYTIATNVLCADTTTSSDRYAPEDRDLYLPLEIAITKWSLADAKKPIEGRVLDSRVWMIDPGPPTALSQSAAKNHQNLHKIKFESELLNENQFIEPDLKQIIKEINNYLSADRLVFSLNLKRIRQDLGCLKWLNRETGGSLKPIRIRNMEDLYVVLIRYFNPSASKMYGQGLANHRMENCTNSYEIRMLCSYHKSTCRERQGECKNCAEALVRVQANVLINDVVEFGKVFEDPQPKPKQQTIPAEGENGHEH